ncbi:hypothetical protein [Kitasatospora purpeofusca]|uniref:hypothetical protein n=1 Tax=Kitasatospora purpeofusca TaxID=67352 RepID=UPI003663B389
MAGIMGRLVDGTRGMVGEAGVEVGRRVYADGYDRAVEISLGVLGQKIDALMKRTMSGDRLSDQELFLLGSLTEFREELTQALNDFWEQGGPSGVRSDERR